VCEGVCVRERERERACVCVCEIDLEDRRSARGGAALVLEERKLGQELQVLPLGQRFRRPVHQPCCRLREREILYKKTFNL
jgi:hypothetical protein